MVWLPWLRRWESWAVGGMVALCCFFLFFRLGHYPCWDDEAVTGLLAGSVWRHGDSVALLPMPVGTSGGGNVMAYDWGKHLVGRVDRAQPPGQLYVMAPFVGWLGNTGLAVRLPMALVGVGVVLLMVRACWRWGVSRRVWVIFGVMLVSNVALWLYLRQGRYYALAIFLVTLAGYWYVPLSGVLRRGEKTVRRNAAPTGEEERSAIADPTKTVAGGRELVGIGVALGVLPLVSSQMFVTFAPLFLLDYVLFGRKFVRFTWRGWAALFGPAVVGVGLVLWLWNPFLVVSGGTYFSNFAYRATMIRWAFRDLNVGHIGVGGLLLAAPLVGWMTGRPGLVRGSVAVAALCVVDGTVDLMTPEWTSFAEVRHMAPFIPVTMAMAVVVIDVAWGRNKWLGVVTLLLAAFTNVLHWGALQPVRLRSVQWEWVKELLYPPETNYGAALEFVKRVIPKGATVGVDPNWMRYPLMYHAPEYVYSWQVRREYFKDWMEKRQLIGEEPPEWLVMFSYRPEGVLKEAGEVAARAGKKYVKVSDIQVNWQDTYRPELTRHRFEAQEIIWKQYQGIYVYRLVSVEP